MARRLRNESPDPAHLAGRWQSIYQVLSLDVAQPLWSWMGLDLSSKDKDQVSQAAKLAYVEFLGSNWNPYLSDYTPERSERIAASFLQKLAQTIGSGSAEQVRLWATAKFKGSTREAVVESQLFGALMALWHDRLGCRSSLQVPEDVMNRIISGIRSYFWPTPYEALEARLEDHDSYSEWDKSVASGFTDDEPAWVANISNNLRVVSVNSLFDDLKCDLSESQFEMVLHWCLEYSRSGGPYSGGTFKFDPTLFSD